MLCRSRFSSFFIEKIGLEGRQPIVDAEFHAESIFGGFRKILKVFDNEKSGKLKQFRLVCPRFWAVPSLVVGYPFPSRMDLAKFQKLRKSENLNVVKLCGQTLSTDARRHGRTWLDENVIP